MGETGVLAMEIPQPEIKPRPPIGGVIVPVGDTDGVETPVEQLLSLLKQRTSQYCRVRVRVRRCDKKATRRNKCGQMRGKR